MITAPSTVKRRQVTVLRNSQSNRKYSFNNEKNNVQVACLFRRTAIQENDVFNCGFGKGVPVLQCSSSSKGQRSMPEWYK